MIYLLPDAHFFQCLGNTAVKILIISALRGTNAEMPLAASRGTG